MTADVRIVTSGDFGSSVADHLRALLTPVGGPVRIAREPVSHPPAFLAGAGLCVRAAWRDVRAEFEAFASAARSARVPWLPVTLRHPYIRIGPAVVFGLGPCHGCYLTRAGQHDQAADAVTAGIEQALTADPHLGVRGIPPHQSMLAAGLALSLAREMEGGRTGTLMTIDCRTDEVASWRVVPAEGCPDCDEGAGR
ncbi:TOMM precursor leader peptide-binding protein [Nonomuraea sp. NPDC050643]|uniref:TOMM precursor leader peptide-binding protein n=1 Tax=Nonomuraea sp. NPDC050643 TaxID=3155660 RepID=UPI0033FE9EFD